MESYLDWHASHYDLFYADKPYAEEAAFVARCLTEYGVPSPGRLLELACGTGRHAVELAGRGYRLTATDHSSSMLAEARRRKEALELGIEFRQQDMRSLDVEGRPFDAVISLFDSIGYVQTNEALLAVLKGAHDHLRSGGLIVLEYWHAAAMLRHYDPVRLRRWRAPEGEVIRISETKLDHARQVAEVTYTVIERRDNGTMRELKETQANRYFLTQEMAGWLERSGFTPLRSFAGFDWERPIDGDTWHIVTVARKSG